MQLSLVIPSYNEEERISKTLNSYISILDKNTSEIIIVCNGCKDNTPNIVKEYIKNNHNIKLLEFKEKIGKGGAIIEGFKIAKGELIGFVDADDSFDAKLVIEMTKKIKEYDCITASKWLGKKFKEVKETTTRKILSRFWNLFIRILLDLKFKDTQAGAKFIKKTALQKILNKLQSKGFEFDVELLYLLNKNNLKTKEEYVEYEPVGGSKFSLKYIPNMLVNLFRIRFRN